MSKKRKKPKPTGPQRPAPTPAAAGATAAAAPAVPPEVIDRERRRDRWSLLGVVLLALVVYANSLGNGLVEDGLSILTRVESVRDPLDLRPVFFKPYRLEPDEVDAAGAPDRPGAYRPLTTWTLAWIYAANERLGLGGAHPTAQHLLDVLLFGAVSGLVFVLARRTLAAPRLAALTTAALFAAHPIHTEVVCSVVGRAELLAALFGLLLLWAHARGASPWACAALLGAALLGKESAAGFAAVAIGHDVLVAPAGTLRRRLWHHGAYVWVGVLWWFGLRAIAVKGADTAMSPSVTANVLAHVDGAAALLTALRVQLDYLRLQALPVGLSSDYSFPQVRPDESVPRALLFLLVLGAVVALAWRLRAARPRVALAILGYAALFAPTSNLLIKIGTVMGERLAFSPSIFFCLLAGEAADAVRCRSPRALRVGAALVVCAFAALTIQRNHTWSDPAAFSRARVEDAPESAPAHYFEALERQKAGDREQALLHLRRAYELYPGSGFEVARGLEVLGEQDDAVRIYRESLERTPRLLPARKRLFALYLRDGRFDEAQALVDDLRRVDPDGIESFVLQSRLDVARGEPPARTAPLGPPVPKGR